MIGPALCHLFELIATLDAAGRFPSFLNGGKQKCDQNADDGDYHQELHERKSFLRVVHNILPFVIEKIMDINVK
jgi:hypothetical protein